MKPFPLADDLIERELPSIPNWHREDDQLVAVFECGDFNGSLGFVNAIAAAANEADHHPDLKISWNEVKVWLSSHDAGGITERDFALARTIDALAPESQR